MDSSAAAEEFPGLYRAILDGIAELERRGRRGEAERIRKAATTAYSGPWAAAGHRRLELQRVRVERALAADGSPAAMTGARVQSVPKPVGSLVRRLRPAR